MSRRAPHFCRSIHHKFGVRGDSMNYKSNILVLRMRTRFTASLSASPPCKLVKRACALLLRRKTDRAGKTLMQSACLSFYCIFIWFFFFAFLTFHVLFINTQYDIKLYYMLYCRHNDKKKITPNSPEDGGRGASGRQSS